MCAIRCSPAAKALLGRRTRWAIVPTPCIAYGLALKQRVTVVPQEGAGLYCACSIASADFWSCSAGTFRADGVAECVKPLSQTQIRVTHTGDAEPMHEFRERAVDMRVCP